HGKPGPPRRCSGTQRGGLFVCRDGMLRAQRDQPARKDAEMAARSSHTAELLRCPLWCIQLGDHGLCAAETAEGSFLVLFTSPLRAGQFSGAAGGAASEFAEAHLSSSSLAQFAARARRAAAEGLCGTVVDLRPDGQAAAVIPFRLAVDPRLAEDRLPGDR